MANAILKPDLQQPLLDSLAPPSVASAHLSVAEPPVRAGRREDAVAAFEAAVENDPGSAAAKLGLARVLFETGRIEEGFQRADDVLRIDMDNLDAWEIVAGSLEALGEPALSALALERLLSLAPERADWHVRLGQLYETLDRPFDAAARFQGALALALKGVDIEVAAHLGLSGLFGRAGQGVEARAHAEEALRLAPGSKGAHQNLAAIADHEGRAAEAEAHREQAFRGASLIVTRALRPRRRVLTLASAARANSPDRYLIPSTRYDRLVWFIAFADETDPAREAFDVVFNAIADPDVGADADPRVADFLSQCHCGVLNPPRAIARTTRDVAQRLFAGLDDLVVPPTTHISATTDLSELDRDRLWLLRPRGSHGGERLERLDATTLSRRRFEGDQYLTAFSDFRSVDGFYRKYRIFFVDRAPFPYHLALHDDWLVHYQSSGTASRRAWLDEERRFLEDPEAALGSGAYRAIVEVGQRLDLDFAVLPDGRALLFEANATMLVHPEAPDGPLAHKNPFVRRILEAFWARLETA